MENKESKVGRPIKENSIGRMPYTTSIRPNVIKWVRHYAIETGQTPADVLETALLVYMNEKEKNH